jgi:hypothetical protein
MAPDHKISEWITGLAGNVPVLDQLMSFLCNDFFIPLVICLILPALWFWFSDPEKRERYQWAVMATPSGMGFAALFVWILNHAFGIDPWLRPYDAIPSAGKAAADLFYFPSDPSFPSNPAAVGFAAATGIWFVNRKLAVFIGFLAVLWSLARIYCGAHYPLDIVAGAAIGIFIACLTRAFFRLIAPIIYLFLRVLRYLRLA